MRLTNESGKPRRVGSSKSPAAEAAKPASSGKAAGRSKPASGTDSFSTGQKPLTAAKPAEAVFDELSSIKASRSRKKAPDPGSAVSINKYRDEVAGRYIEFHVADGNNEIHLGKGADGKAQVTVDGKTYKFDESKYDHIIIDGGAGNDRITVDADFGEKVGVWGGAGNDTIRLKAGDSVVEGQEGDDVIYGGPGSEHLSGNEGNDRIYGGGGRDMLYGDEGDDVLSGGSGKDFISGGKGKDVLRGGSGDDELYSRKAEGDTVDPGSGKNTVQEDRW
jgi:Ca2+-binding RTX toxin-like protein